MLHFAAPTILFLMMLHQIAGADCNVDWKLDMTTEQQAVTVRPGGKVIFAWSGHHNVADMRSLSAFTSCNMSSAVELSTAVEHGSHSHRRLAAASETKETYSFEAGKTAGKIYLSCSVNGHCSAGQKLIVTVSDTDAVKCPEATSDGGIRNRIHSVPLLLMVLAVAFGAVC